LKRKRRTASKLLNAGQLRNRQGEKQRRRRLRRTAEGQKQLQKQAHEEEAEVPGHEALQHLLQEITLAWVDKQDEVSAVVTLRGGGQGVA
jgi:hypothetical protein